jgi:hypothetical protein
MAKDVATFFTSKAIKIKEANRKKHKTQLQSSEQLEEIIPTDQQGKQNSKPLETNKNRNKKRKSQRLETPKIETKKPRKNPRGRKLMILVPADEDESTEAFTTDSVLHEASNDSGMRNPEGSAVFEATQVSEAADTKFGDPSDSVLHEASNDSGMRNPEGSAVFEATKVSEAADTNVGDRSDSVLHEASNDLALHEASNDSGMRNPEVSAVLDATQVSDLTISAVDGASIEASDFYYVRAMVDQGAPISISLAFETAEEVFLSIPRVKDINRTLIVAFKNKLLSLSNSKKIT